MIRGTRAIEGNDENVNGTNLECVALLHLYTFATFGHPFRRLLLFH